jgi:two-component system response regulator
MFEPHSILVIDDDPDYLCLLQIAVQEARISYPLEIKQDGRAAVNYLQQFASQKAAVGSPPGLILLDLRMPRVSGLEVLRWIRSQQYLDDVAVVVLTGIESEDELAQAIQLGATSFRVKPFSYRQLVQEIKDLSAIYLDPHEVKQAA